MKSKKRTRLRLAELKGVSGEFEVAAESDPEKTLDAEREIDQ